MTDIDKRGSRKGQKITTHVVASHTAHFSFTMLRILCPLLLLLGAADSVTFEVPKLKGNSVTFELRKRDGIIISNRTSADTVSGSVVINNSSLLCPPAAGGNYSHDILNVICR